MTAKLFLKFLWPGTRGPGECPPCPSPLLATVHCVYGQIGVASSLVAMTSPLLRSRLLFVGVVGRTITRIDWRPAICRYNASSWVEQSDCSVHSCTWLRAPARLGSARQQCRCGERKSAANYSNKWHDKLLPPEKSLSGLRSRVHGYVLQYSFFSKNFFIPRCLFHFCNC